jgi:large subunit ribosomal protein L35
MPKMKTMKGVKERIRVTGTGKLIANRPGRRHLLAGKRSKTMRKLRRRRTLYAADARRIRALMPYNT